MTGTVYLGGGGSPQDEGLLWAQMLQGCRRLLYWPFALDGDPLAGAESWLTGELARLGASPRIDVWTELDNRKPADLLNFDFLFVGGGNTFWLLQHINSHGFLAPVQRWVRAGGHYYGGSAGAILATDSIATAHHLDHDITGLTDLSGLGLLSGVGLLPHYTTDQRELVRAISVELAQPVLAVPEAAGLVVEGAQIRTVGPDPVWTVDANSTIEHPPGSRLR